MEIKYIFWFKSLWRSLRNNPENYCLTIKIYCSKEELKELNLKDLEIINSVLQEVS